jgi:DNA replication protein DnaC
VRELSCELCGGVGFEIVESEGRQYARPCACRRPALAAHGDLPPSCRIPPRYEHCSLESFTGDTKSQVAALEKVMRYCTGYPFTGADEGLGLLFTGDNGVGKTHLAVAVLRELVTNRGARGEFWDFHELIRTIKSSYNPETRTTEEQVLDPVVSTDVLLLDDLGAWKMTDWMIDTLFYILNSRYLSKRVTLITTNFQDGDRQTVLGANNAQRREFLVERIGPRLRSRLMEMCLVIRMEAGDWREAQQSGKLRAVVGRGDTAASEQRPPGRRGQP